MRALPLHIRNYFAPYFCAAAKKKRKRRQEHHLKNYAVYDFSGVQYRSFLRSRHLIVRGERGEWNDNLIYYLDEKNQPKREYLMPVIREKYAALDTQYLRDLRKTWKPELSLDTRQDEYAIATMLYDMREFLDGGDEIYPLREALDDAYFWLLMNKAVALPWTEIKAQDVPWHLISDKLSE